MACRGTPTFRAADAKREEFRRYLEKAGVTEVLNKVLTNLYDKQEKPPDALLFIATQLGHCQAGQPTIDALRVELQVMREQMDHLRADNERMRCHLEAQAGGDGSSGSKVSSA